jgi:hypothetical protein
MSCVLLGQGYLLSEGRHGSEACLMNVIWGGGG